MEAELAEEFEARQRETVAARAKVLRRSPATRRSCTTGPTRGPPREVTIVDSVVMTRSGRTYTAADGSIIVDGGDLAAYDPVTLERRPESDVDRPETAVRDV